MAEGAGREYLLVEKGNVYTRRGECQDEGELERAHKGLSQEGKRKEVLRETIKAEPP
jgi:hypothetical protein